MKSTLLRAIGAAGLFFGLSSAGSATPNQRVTVTERMLGSDDDAFAVLRTEHDNLGSHYAWKERTYLIERTMDGSGTEKRTLLSEVSGQVDMDHQDPRTPPPVHLETLSRDDSVSLADVLLRYPDSEARPWSDAERKRILAAPAVGLRLDDRLDLIAGSRVEREVFDGIEPSAGWELAGIHWQGRCLFASLSKEMPEGAPDTRIVGFGEELAAQVRAHLDREEIYLRAGVFESRDEAIAKATEWRKRQEEEKIRPAVEWEVWSRRLPTGKTDHVVVVKRSGEWIASGNSDRVAEPLGIRFEAMSSRRFERWIPVP